MPRNNNKMLTHEDINFDLLHSDIRAFCKENDTNIAQLSTDRLYRSNSYLSARLSEKRMQLNALVGLCNIIGQPVKRYEIAKESPREEQPQEKAIENEWGCKVMVNTEFSIVSFVLLHNGEEFAKAHANLQDSSDKGIAKAISYAAHVCYKAVEQKDFVNRIFLDDEQAFTMDAFSHSIPFKEYIRPFVAEKTDRGELARYVSQNFAVFPSWGEKKMRLFLMESRASKQVITAFDAAFGEYRKWAARG